MAKGRIVIKRIAGSDYLYYQYSYRDKFTRKVVTVSLYIGPKRTKKRLDEISQIFAGFFMLLLTPSMWASYEPKLIVDYKNKLAKQTAYEHWHNHERLKLEQIQAKARETEKPRIPLTPEEISAKDEWKVWNDHLYASTRAVPGGRVPNAVAQEEEEQPETPALPLQSDDTEQVPLEEPELPASDEPELPGEQEAASDQSLDAPEAAGEASPDASEL